MLADLLNIDGVLDDIENSEDIENLKKAIECYDADRFFGDKVLSLAGLDFTDKVSEETTENHFLNMFVRGFLLLKAFSSGKNDNSIAFKCLYVAALIAASGKYKNQVRRIYGQEIEKYLNGLIDKQLELQHNSEWNNWDKEFDKNSDMLGEMSKSMKLLDFETICVSDIQIDKYLKMLLDDLDDFYLGVEGYATYRNTTILNRRLDLMLNGCAASTIMYDFTSSAQKKYMYKTVTDVLQVMLKSLKKINTDIGVARCQNILKTIENTYNEARIEFGKEYWKKHPDEKESLELSIKNKEKEAADCSKGISDTKFDDELREASNILRNLEDEKSKLGFFKFEEKKQAQSKIDAQSKTVTDLKKKIENEKSAKKEKINELKREVNDLKEQLKYGKE